MQKVWSGLEAANRKAELAPLLKNRVGSEELYNKLFGAEACTLTGRIRSHVSRTKFLNTPISGLAADGAKLALFNLTQIGYRIVAMIHDEILVEVPANGKVQHEAQWIQQVLIQSMNEVTGNLVKGISCSSEILMDSWKSY